MGGNLYRRNDVKRRALNWGAVVLALFLAASAFATPENLSQDQNLSQGQKAAAPKTLSRPKSAPSQNLSQDQKAAPKEFAAEEFISEWGGSGFYQELDLPGAWRPEVEPYRKRWLSARGRAELKTILENGSRYRHYVKRRLQEEGLPACIECIPVIESSYKPLAKPASGKSVGLWQFMENSIENYLVKNDWIDERRDPWKSTDAAIKKLKANYNQFGDWLLAIAAYNCGAGAVKRALKKTSQKTFWSLSEQKLIPDHAIAYVPNLLAVSDIAQNSFWYGVDLPQAFFDAESYSPYDDFDYLEVNEAVSLRALAAELRIDPNFLLELNPALLYEMTPPGQECLLRLPRGTKAAVQDAIFSLNKRNEYADSK